MSFTTTKFQTAIQQLLSAPKIQDSVLISAGNSVIDDIIHWGSYVFNFLKKIDNTITTTPTLNYITVSSITDFSKVIDIFIDEIKQENRLLPKSRDSLFSLSVSPVTFDIQSVEYSNALPQFYCDEIESGKIYFEKEFPTAEKLIIIYKKTISNISALVDVVPLPDKFESAYYHGLVEYCIPAAQNIQNFSTEYYRNSKYSRLKNIMLDENSKNSKFTGFNSNYAVQYLSEISRLTNPNFY